MEEQAERGEVEEEAEEAEEAEVRVEEKVKTEEEEEEEELCLARGVEVADAMTAVYVFLEAKCLSDSEAVCCW